MDAYSNLNSYQSTVFKKRNRRQHSAITFGCTKCDLEVVNDLRKIIAQEAISRQANWHVHISSSTVVRIRVENHALHLKFISRSSRACEHGFFLAQSLKESTEYISECKRSADNVPNSRAIAPVSDPLRWLLAPMITVTFIFFRWLWILNSRVIFAFLFQRYPCQTMSQVLSSKASSIADGQLNCRGIRHQTCNG